MSKLLTAFRNPMPGFVVAFAFYYWKYFSLYFVGSYILRRDHAAGFTLFLARMNIHLEVAIRIIYIHNLSLIFSFGYTLYTHRHHGDQISITLLSVFPPYQGHTYTPTLTYTGMMWMRCSNLHALLWPKFWAQGCLILDMFLLSLCILCNPSGSHFSDAQISRVLIKCRVLHWDLRKNIQVEITCKVGSEVMSGLTLTCWVPGAWRAFSKIILIDIYGFPTSFASPLEPSLANMSRICVFWFQTVNMNSF